jgi:hypothetical protein
MPESLEEETYSILDLLKEDDSKKTRSHGAKLLLRISEAINLGYESLKHRIALHKASPSAYLGIYRAIMQADRLFELEAALKDALGVKAKTLERIEAVQKAKRPKFPIRMSGDRYKPPQKKRVLKQLDLFFELLV